MRTILLNPGPVTLSDAVCNALPGPDLCHREPEFFDMQDRVREKLLAVYDLDPAHWATVLLSGSGTAAMEAMISSLVPEDGKLLVIENGVYGERLSRIAEIHGIDFEALNYAWGEKIDPDIVADFFTQHTDISHLAVVQHETTTGRLNDIPALLAVCKKAGVRMLLDGVSSFGAEAIDYTESLDAVAATANKCLHGIPGLAFVIVRRSALEYAPELPRTLYLNLPRYCELQDQHSVPFTPAVPAYTGLEAALDEMAEQGGWRSRRNRYRQLSGIVENKLVKMGVVPLMTTTESSCVLRAWRLPSGMTYQQLHDNLKENGFIIYAGQGGFAAEMFRISTMGDISDDDINRLIQALEQALS
ncbi:MAG: 2-aminoethylphosphonate aminotransferase [Proteobacteria bacterium]|nr:2-aminoethylphosphonate aminotransferase [Pseudomonadota bacterium]